MSFNSGRALLIGVGTYEYAPHVNVPITANDALQVDKVLRNQDLCGYPDGQVTLLHDAKAERKHVLAALDALKASRPDDTVLIFFSGHGDYGTDGRYYLTTHDTKVDNGKVKAGTGVSEAELIDKLRAIPAQRLLFLFNACHSGEVSPSLGMAGEREALGSVSLPDEAADALLATGEGRIIISACRSSQRSWIGGGAVTLYAQALIDGLSGKGYVTSNRGYVSAFNLYEHIYFNVKAAAAQLGQTQEPELTVLKGIGPVPVALYRGATELGLLPDDEPLPEGTAARPPVDPEHSRRLFERYVRSVTVTASGERSVAAGGDMNRNTIVTGDGNVVQQARGRNVAQAAPGGQANVTDRSRSTVFDQRGQKVQTQYNVAGDFNFSAAQDRTAALGELRKLLEEIGRAAREGVLDDEAATDAEYAVKKAVQQAEKPDADKQTIVDYLTKAKDVIVGVASGVTAATGFATAISQAIQMVQKLF